MRYSHQRMAVGEVIGQSLILKGYMLQRGRRKFWALWPSNATAQGLLCKKSKAFARCRDGGRKRERRWHLPESLPNCTKGLADMLTLLCLSFGREILGLGVCAFGGPNILPGIVALQRTCACSRLLYIFQPTNSLLLVSCIEKGSTHASFGGPKRITSCSKE